MAKGYWIGRVDVHNDEGYKPNAAADMPPSSKIRRPLPRARGKLNAWKGRALRNVVIEFPDYAAALACYRSPEYQAQYQASRAANPSVDLIIVEGYDGPQP